MDQDKKRANLFSWNFQNLFTQMFSGFCIIVTFNTSWTLLSPSSLHSLLSFSISSTLMEMESTVSSGRSTPAMMNGQSSASSSGVKTVGYPCCWDLCSQCFNSSPDLAEHIRGIHVDGQRGEVSILSTFGQASCWCPLLCLTGSQNKIRSPFFSLTLTVGMLKTV